jgi:hypothetical protein
MPMWERRVPEPEAASVEPAPPEAVRPRRAAGGRARRVADPYDATDEGANCLRCGYAIEPARDRRGLLTCAGCA